MMHTFIRIVIFAVNPTITPFNNIKQDNHYKLPQLSMCQYPVANKHVKSLGCVTIQLTHTKKLWSPCMTSIGSSNFEGDFNSDFFEKGTKESLRKNFFFF